MVEFLALLMRVVQVVVGRLYPARPGSAARTTLPVQRAASGGRP